MNIAFQLFQIQNIDTAIDNARSRISEIDDEITNNTQISKAETSLELNKQTYIQNSNEFNSINDAIEKKKIKKSQSQSSLYSGKVQNPKELEDLQLEISSLEKAILNLDKSLLEALIKLEASEQNLEIAKENLTSEKSKFATKKSMLLAEKENLSQKIIGLEKKRVPIYDMIDTSNKSLYASLRTNKRGLAVSKLSEGGCGACGANFTASQQQNARSSLKFFICPNCGRIVYGST